MSGVLAPMNASALQALAARGTQVPQYARTMAPGVLHLGLGAFHRAHQALVFDTLLQQGDARWGVLGVSMRNPALADVLALQQGLYTVRLASAEGAVWRVGGAVLQTCVAAQDPARVHAAMAAPALRWVTLTVTEKGYAPALAALLLEGLRQRRAAGLGGLTIASCDNLRDNGRTLQALCVQAAQAQDAALADWIQAHCAFPNSMVDRIVPAADDATLARVAVELGVADSAPLATEQFWEWVIEDRFADPTDAAVLSSAGVTVVDDVAPFEEAKLRLLNASHTAMACIGAVAGMPLVSDCVATPALQRFIHGLMTQEVGPLVRRPGWPAYRDALLRRFANPALQHSVHQIASDSSQKIPQRWVPCIEAALQAGAPVAHLAFAAAAWMRYVRGVDDAGAAYGQRDPMAAELQRMALCAGHDPQQAVRLLGTLPTVWGLRLAQDTVWHAQVARSLGRIDQSGMLAALADFPHDTPHA